MTSTPTGPDLLRGLGLRADGPVLWGSPVRESGPGVYVVELPHALPAAPIDHVAVARWLERTPSLRLDGERPTTKALATRLASYWLPDQTVVLVGSSKGSLRARIAAIQATPLGDPRPNARAYWLMTLRHVETSRVWWAATDAPEEHEDALLDAFAAGVSEASRAQVREPDLVLPFGVLGRPTGERRRHGLTGALRPESTVDATVAPGRRPTRDRPTPKPRGLADGSSSRRVPRVAATAPATRATPQVDLTSEGLRQLEEELRALREVRRPETVKRVAAARELGDLRENAEYHASREELGFIDGRIRLLESRLNNAVVFERPAIAAGAALGSVVVVDAGDGTHELRLVGSTESDPGTGRISTSSPVGRALLGRSAGEEVAVTTPAGERRYRIVEVR